MKAAEMCMLKFDRVSRKDNIRNDYNWGSLAEVILGMMREHLL